MPYRPAPVAGTDPAEPHEAAAYFSSFPRFETDCWEVQDAKQHEVPGFVLLGVRSPGAHAAGHLPAGLDLPHGHIVERSVYELPATDSFVVLCAGPHGNGADRSRVDQLPSFAAHLAAFIGLNLGLGLTLGFFPCLRRHATASGSQRTEPDRWRQALASIYVAIVGIDVHDQPGGIHAWIRLGSQPLFVWPR